MASIGQNGAMAAGRIHTLQPSNGPRAGLTDGDRKGEEGAMTHSMRPLAATKAAILFVSVATALVAMLCLSGGMGLG